MSSKDLFEVLKSYDKVYSNHELDETYEEKERVFTNELIKCNPKKIFTKVAQDQLRVPPFILENLLKNLRKVKNDVELYK